MNNQIPSQTEVHSVAFSTYGTGVNRFHTIFSGCLGSAPRIASVLLAACLLAPASSSAASLIFVESPTTLTDFAYPGWDHVGVEVDGWVYESHPGYDYHPNLPYPPGFCWGITRWVLVANVSGVQMQHTTESFISNSADPGVSGNAAWVSVPIPENVGSAMNWLYYYMYRGSPYPPAAMFLLDDSPAFQKGNNSKGYMTCVGLAERMAEDAGVNGGQGYIPAWAEGRCEQHPIIAMSPIKFCPQLLYACATSSSRFSAARSYLTAFLDPVDFIVTDPAGRRIGYTEGIGALNEIPDAFFTGQDAQEQFVILDPLPGTYQVTLYGLGQVPKVFMTAPGVTYYFEQQLGTNEVHADTFTIAGTNGTANPRPVIRAVAGGMEISWQTASGYSYTLERCADIAAPVWEPVSGQENVAGTGSPMACVEPRLTQSFYRVVYRLR